MDSPEGREAIPLGDAFGILPPEGGGIKMTIEH